VYGVNCTVLSCEYLNRQDAKAAKKNELNRQVRQDRQEKIFLNRRGAEAQRKTN